MNETLSLNYRLTEDKIALLNKRLQTSESEKSEYIKCYEDAMNDKKQLTHEYMNRITELRVLWIFWHKKQLNCLETPPPLSVGPNIQKEGGSWASKQ